MFNPTRSERSFVTYKSVLREKKEDAKLVLKKSKSKSKSKSDENNKDDIDHVTNALPIEESVAKRFVVPKWEKKRIAKKRNAYVKTRQTEMDLTECISLYFDI